MVTKITPRVINASSARYVRLSIGGAPFRIIGTDGGLIEAPVEVTEVLLPAADRVEVLVGPFTEGQTLEVESLRYMRMTMKKRDTERFATLKVGPAKPSVAMIPERLRTIEPIASTDAAPTRTVKLSVGLSLRRGLDFRVNGEEPEELDTSGFGAAVNQFIAEQKADAVVKFRLATGNVGVMAATNEVIEEAELKSVLWVYAVIGALIVLSYRSLQGVLIIGIPLFLVTIFANALMALFGIGLKVATLPVVTLAVGIGVDYGIYVYDVLRHHLDDDAMSLRDAYVLTLRQTGKAVVFTGLCLAGGVFAWLFSGLQFQRDMGQLLVVMFLANMLGAVLLGPALARFLLRPREA